ncbi:MAG: ADP-ribosylglycohydrolase family protein [Gammaproteobacteria bacterium]|nr:ADP-ribosylglycohydrolase family protein [Gammaproteobacteria bacterium]MBV9724715.1 ADP-ribosylglycohydrolase family protein [Gammaproteobacteria bacterium]
MNLSPVAAALALPLPNSYWVAPGRLLAGEHPAGPTAEVTRERVSRLLETGIDCFLDLTQPHEIVPYEAALPAGVRYLRHSIPDHGIPHHPAHMGEILDALQRALSEGRVVYLHCRAGIGRTGMVVGCLLAEQGLPGEPALTELNRLWHQSARSGLWPSVPETPEQVEYVRAWQPRRARESDPLLEPATLAAARGLRERFQGTLLGLATGDAVAAATQHGRPGRFTPVGDMLGGGPFDLPRGAWTDDTAMALCLAESLLEREGFDAHDQVMRYRRWQQEGYLSATGQCVGITAGTARALALAQWRRQPFAGTHDPSIQDSESLSRLAPVVMYFFAAGPAVAAEHAAQAARTTCQAPLVLEACRGLARALHAALSGRPKPAIMAAAASPTGPHAGAALHGAPATLAAALQAFEGTANFRESVLAAANLGGNSDVVAAACGAIAGAHYCASAIPALWRDSLLQRALLEGYADRLLTHALLGLGE